MHDSSHQSELALVKRAKNQDPKAFSQLYERVYQDMYCYACYVMKHRQDAEDMVSSTVIIAFENIKQLRKDERFRSWIFQILTNQCKKKLIANSRQVSVEHEVDSAVDYDYPVAHSVKEAFRHLSDEERIIIALSVFGGYNSREISEKLDINANTIRSKRSRALEKMSFLLKDEEEMAR